MKSQILWKAKQSQKNASNLFRYEKFLFSKYKFKVTQKYSKILKWSIDNPKKFWSSIWDFAKVKGLKRQDHEKSNIFFKNKFLKNSKLNFAENLLSKNDDSKAITFISENNIKKVRTWRDLNINVYKLITFFKSIKIKEKDRVAAYLPNLIETVESFIATSAIGSIWSSCSPDFGTQGVVDRFKQIEPSILITSDHYFYNGKKINILEKVDDILKQIPSIKKTLVFSYNENEKPDFKDYVNFNEVLNQSKKQWKHH